MIHRAVLGFWVCNGGGGLGEPEDLGGARTRLGVVIGAICTDG